MDNNIEDLENMSVEEFEQLSADIENGTYEEENLPEPEEPGIDDQPRQEEEESTTEDPIEENQEPVEQEPIIEEEPNVLPDVEESEVVTEVAQNSDQLETDTTLEEEEESVADEQEVKIPDEYIKAKEFYDALSNAEYKANGKTMKPFMDVDSIIQMHQYGFGFHKKNEEFNKFRPVLKTLQENGLIDNPTELNYLLDLKNKNPEAIKKLIKESGLDVISDYDPEEKIDFQPGQYVEQNQNTVVDQIFDAAKVMGIEEQLINTIETNFDDETQRVFVEDPIVRKEFMEHIQTGQFDNIDTRVKQLEISDTTGGFRQLPYVKRYAIAMNQVNGEYSAQVEQQQQLAKQQAKLEAEKKAIEEQRRQEQYAAELAKKEAAIDAQRKAAANATKPTRRTTSSSSTKKFDPLEMNHGDFGQMLDKFLAGEIDL